MALRPPTHRIDAAAEYVYRDDPAWDEDRITRETSELYGGKVELHPVARYLGGETRFDMAAMFKCGGATLSVNDYLTTAPTVFTLRRMTVREYAAFQDILGNAGPTQALERACTWGVVSCSDFDLPHNADGSLSEDAMADLFDTGGLGLINALGGAVAKLSLPPSEAEKKA